MTVSKVEVRIYRISLEHLVASENKEVLKTHTHTHKNTNKHTSNRIMSERHRCQVKELPMAKSGTI